MQKLENMLLEITNAYKNKKPYLPDQNLATLQEAYLLQDLISQQLGKTVGWKIGYQGGVQFVKAPLVDSTFFQSGSNITRNHFRLCLVECELAVIFKKSMPIKNKVYSEKEIIENIGSIRVGIEICDSRLSDYPKSTQYWQIADQLSNAGYVIGTGIDFTENIFNPQIMDQANFSFNITDNKQNKRLALSENKNHPFKDTKKLIVDFIENLIREGKSINAGDVITTGSFCGSHEVFVGDTVVAQFKNIGEASLKVI